jgi:hypothetical protein
VSASQAPSAARRASSVNPAAVEARRRLHRRCLRRTARESGPIVQARSLIRCPTRALPARDALRRRTGGAASRQALEQECRADGDQERQQRLHCRSGSGRAHGADESPVFTQVLGSLLAAGEVLDSVRQSLPPDGRRLLSPCARRLLTRSDRHSAAAARREAIDATAPNPETTLSTPAA